MLFYAKLPAMNRLSPLLIALALAGCASSEQIAQRNSAAQAAMVAQDDSYCASIGAPPGSPNHTQCRLTMLQRRDQQAAADSARQMAASQALLATGAALAAGPNLDPVTPVPNIIPQQTRCRSMMIGGIMQTVCQ